MIVVNDKEDKKKTKSSDFSKDRELIVPEALLLEKINPSFLNKRIPFVKEEEMKGEKEGGGQAVTVSTFP